jgi:hypothetical protein
VSQVIAEVAEPAEAVPATMPDGLDGRTIQGRRWQTYKDTLIQGCGGSPTPVQMLLADRIASLLLRANSLHRKADRYLFAVLTDAAALLVLQLSGKSPSRRYAGPGETHRTVIGVLA